MRHQSATRDTNTDSPWTYRETIDEANSAIRVLGHVDRLGVDLLRGTIEELSRRGHRHITVTVEEPGTVDAYARAILAEVAELLERRDGQLTIRWSTDEEDGAPALVAGSGRDGKNGLSPHSGEGVSRNRRAAG
jgi:hypothetical protein